MSSSEVDRDEGEVWVSANDGSSCPPSPYQGKGVRSLRRVRAPPAGVEDSQRPAKRRCLPASASLSDFNDADIAEMLLGLSHDHSSSPRDSHASDDDCLVMSPRSSREGGTQMRRGETARRSKRVGRQPLKLLEMELESEEEEEEDGKGAESEGRSQTPPTKRDIPEKKIPARCKCGKRVSASHPPCKSELMLLCERFRDRFFHVPKGPGCRIDLNECATVLGVARRRLYDITIVYEAAEVILRTGKLAYVWQGLGHLPELVQRLRREEEMGRPVGDRRGNAHAALVPEKQATHSLWTLSRKFIRLLLITEGAIQLSDAAEHLIGGPCKEGKKQQTRLTVERRLYDIGSILSTLNLIQRTYVEGKRQPAFSWNWQWAAADALPGGDSPPDPQETLPAKLANPAGLMDAWPAVSPEAGAVSPRWVAPRLAAPATAGSPAAVDPPLGHTLPQLLFPVLVAAPGESGQMGPPTFPAISHPVITSGVPNATLAFPGAAAGQHVMPQLGAPMTQLGAQHQAAAPAPSSKAHLMDFLHHCTDVANTQYLLTSGKHYRSIFQASQPMN